MITHLCAPRMTADQIAGRRADLIREADRAHDAYPQYRGYWAGREWRLGVITQDVRTKAGLAFSRGEVVIARENRSIFGNRLESITGYSVSNQCNTSMLPFGFVRWIEPVA